MKVESEDIKPHPEILQRGWTTIANDKIVRKNNAETK
jgi:hypothetical protein